MDEAERLLAKLKTSLPKEECGTCDCLQGLLSQLELDLGSEIRPLTKPLRVTDREMHGCLGCNPCPPAEIFAEYTRERRGKWHR